MTIDFDSICLPNEYLNDEHKEWQTQLRRFFDKEIMPFATEWDEQGDIPADMWGKAANMGILGLGYSEEFGGTNEGIDIWHKNILSEEFARVGAGGVGTSLMVHNIGLPPVVNFAKQHLKDLIAYLYSFQFDYGDDNCVRD